jgi:tetratricopeptide (TPR) repeat protein
MQKEGIAHPTWDPAIMQRVTQSVLSRIDTKAHSLALMNVCKVMGWAGKREEAYRVALQAVNLRPDIAAVQFEAGLAADLLNRKDEAMAYYRRAVEIQPAHANAHCNLGVILEDRGQLQEAIIHFTLALKYGNPKDAQRDSRNLASATQKLRQEQNRD